MYNFITALRVFIIYAILLGIGYPALITAIGHFFMPQKASGSLIIKNNQIVGSTLIGQRFTDEKFFHNRFSDVNYDAANSGANNLGPTNKKLFALITSRIKKIHDENQIGKNIELPADMVLSSASGLDPHISVENALLQLPRVAHARGIPAEKIKKLITKNTDPDFIGIWGRPGVNVLKLNLALEDDLGK